MDARQPPRRGKEMLHTGMWTLLGMMAIGLALVPLLRPSIVVTSLFFGWSNVMVGYMAWRITQDVRTRPRLEAPPMQASPVVPYRVRRDAPHGERPSTALAPEP